MERLLKTCGIILLSNLLAVFIPLTFSLHRHAEAKRDANTWKILTVDRSLAGSPENRQCDICARLVLQLAAPAHAPSIILSDYEDISFEDNGISFYSQLFSRLKARSPPVAATQF